MFWAVRELLGDGGLSKGSESGRLGLEVSWLFLCLSHLCAPIHTVEPHVSTAVAVSHLINALSTMSHLKPLTKI